MSKGFKRVMYGMLCGLTFYVGLRVLADAYIGSKTGFFEINVNLPKSERQKEDFSRFSEGELEIRLDEEIAFFKDKSNVDLNSVYGKRGIIYFTSEGCGPCKGLDKYVFDEFVKAFDDKLRIIKFYNTFDNEANCISDQIADCGTPTVCFFDGELIGKKEGFSSKRVELAQRIIYSNAGKIVQENEKDPLMKVSRFLTGRY